MRVQGFPSAALGFSIPGRDLLLSLPVGAVSARVSPLRGAGRRTSPETIAVDLCAAVLSVSYRSVASRGAAPCLLLWSLAPTDPVIVRLCCRACLFWFPPLPIRKNSASLHSCTLLFAHKLGSRSFKIFSIDSCLVVSCLFNC